MTAPRVLFFRLTMDGRPMDLAGRAPLRHMTALDYRTGVYRRETDFGPVTITGERFASMAEEHLAADRLRFRFEEDSEIVLRVGISREIWNINGPHLHDFRSRPGGTLLCEAVTGEKGITVAAAQTLRTDSAAAWTEGEDCRVLRRRVQRGETLTVAVFAAICTSLDGPTPGEEARRLAEAAAEAGFDRCLEAHEAAWEAIHRRSLIDLDSTEEAQLALHASQYHLNAIAPRHARSRSIPARGLSGQTYKGAIFWDSEIFFFPMFVHTQPEIARSLLRYRIETLPGALKKAAGYGYRGAFYAWESQDGGEEGCTNFNVVDVFTHRPVRTYFRDKQIHISADIAYALRQYYEITGDRRLLEEGGAEVILQCARFYLSRASAHLDRDSLDLADVIGPDEYHERVTNNAFTNEMARYCLESALLLEQIFRDRHGYLSALLEKLHFEKDWAMLPAAAERLRRPHWRDGVLEQFDGYFAMEDCSLDTVRARLRDPREYWGGDHGVAGHTQIIKQADVIALMAMLPERFTDEDVEAAWAYYEPRTEHGSSLSACMYALTACRVGRLDRAWELFMRSASIDLLGGGKQWAGEIYIGGTHPASNGGAWTIAVLGFAGLRVRNGVLELRPRLPEQISRLRFPVTLGDRRLLVTVTHEGWTAEPDGK